MTESLFQKIALVIVTTTLMCGAVTVTWDPLVKQQRDGDVVFMPDLSSLQSITDEGGFLWGHHNETSAQVVSKYSFGPGKYGPAVRADTSSDCDWTYVGYPADGLMPADEFTVEFWANPGSSWSQQNERTVLQIGRNARGCNGLGLTITGTTLHYGLTINGTSINGSKTFTEAGFSENQWNQCAFTFKNNVLKLYVNGVLVIDRSANFHKTIWSDGADQGGIVLGGRPGGASHIWVSDLRISRTARIPGIPVTLRDLQSEITVDVSKKEDQVPLFGSLHCGGPTVEQGKSALQVIRTDKILNSTPIKFGGTDATHPTLGKTGRYSYDWQVCDRTFDWIVSHASSAYISIDATPSIIGGSSPPFSGTDLTTYYSGYSYFPNDKPNDYLAWEDIVEDLVHHVIVEKKYPVMGWGVWNEPNEGGFWSSGEAEYLRLYEHTVKAVRRADPAAMVGGPEVSSFDNQNWINNLFAKCKTQGLPLDFIAVHDYSGDLGSTAFMRSEVDKVASANGYPTPFPLIVGEFNWTAGNMYRSGVARHNTAMWHLRALTAAYTTAYLSEMTRLKGYKYLCFSHTAYGDPRVGGWASDQLIGPNGEQWAPFNVLKGWKTVMGDRVLAAQQDLSPGVYSCAASDSTTRKVGIALANYGFAQHQARTASVIFNNLPSGIWKLRKYIVNELNSSRWDIAEDSARGAVENDLKMITDSTITGGNPITLHVTLPRWTSLFIGLTSGTTTSIPVSDVIRGEGQIRRVEQEKVFDLSGRRLSPAAYQKRIMTSSGVYLIVRKNSVRQVLVGR